MRDFTYNYIPDLTERYPEGFRTFDEPYDESCDYGYEPSYEELVVTDSDYAEHLIEWLQENPKEAYAAIKKYNSKAVSTEKDDVATVTVDEDDEDILPFN